jgi:hypothetical protein
MVADPEGVVHGILDRYGSSTRQHDGTWRFRLLYSHFSREIEEDILLMGGRLLPRDWLDGECGSMLLGQHCVY